MNRKKVTYKSELLGEEYTVFYHESGLPIYIFPKKMSTAYALLATDYGAVDATLDAAGNNSLPAGVAHFLEHKLFSNEDGTDSFERFSALGADANAYTSHTRTVYLFSCTDHFAESLAELIDFVTHPYFTEESVQKEQGIIGEEIRMCLDNPYDRCYYNMLEGLYTNHPVKTDICGSVASISAITPKILYDTHSTYYRLSNMALVVCGDVDAEEVLAIANAHLPQATEQGKVPRRLVEEPRTAHRATVTEEGHVAKPIFSIGVKDVHIPDSPEERLKRDATMAILNEMLFSEAGELYNKLYGSGMISPELSADYVLTRDFAFLQIAGESESPEQVMDEIWKYFEKLRREGLSSEDFERCRRIEYAEYIKSFDSTEEIANTLLSFVFEGVELFSYADVILGVTSEDVTALFVELFDPACRTLSVIYPNS